MTDKELLELAAKAAGIDRRRLPSAWPDRFDDDQWNPLIDDGDALRLAVKLDLTIEGAFTMAFSKADFAIDPYAATRRVIVRAAAKIGKELK